MSKWIACSFLSALNGYVIRWVNTFPEKRKEKEKEKTTPFGVYLLRSQVLFHAAQRVQVILVYFSPPHTCLDVLQAVDHQEALDRFNAAYQEVNAEIKQVKQAISLCA